MARNYAELVPPVDAHYHADCKHWCHGQTCKADRVARTAPAKCRTCRTDDFNRRQREARS